MSLAKRSARRRGMLMGAAIASSRNKKAASVAAPAPVASASVAAPTAATSQDNIRLLKELADLRDSGILTEEEFAAKKKKILDL